MRRFRLARDWNKDQTGDEKEKRTHGAPEVANSKIVGARILLANRATSFSEAPDQFASFHYKNKIPPEAWTKRMQPDRDFWRNRPVCVLGGTGFLGYHLSRQLREVGARVRVFGLPPSEHHPLRNEPGFDLRFGDVLKFEPVRDAVGGCSLIFNLAGVVSPGRHDPDTFRAIHVEAVRNAIRAADPSARLVHTSSVTAIGATRRPVPLDENSPFTLERLQIDYMHAKRAAEQEALAAAGERDIVVVNPGYLIGPEDYDLSVMGSLCQRFWRGNVPFAPPGGFNLVDVRDAATGHLLAAERGKRGERYILGGENCSQIEFLRLLARQAGWRPRWLPRVPGWFLFSWARVEEMRARLRGNRPFPSLQDARVGVRYWYYSSTKAATELGFLARPLLTSVADTYSWHQARGFRPLPKLRRAWLRPPQPAAAASAPPSAE